MDIEKRGYYDIGKSFIGQFVNPVGGEEINARGHYFSQLQVSIY